MTHYGGSNNVNSCPERPGGDGGGGGGIRRIQNKFGEIVWRRKPTSQASNSPNKRCRRSKTGRCLVHRCPYVEVCQRERWLKRGDDGKISFETKEVYREVCEIFAREGGLNYNSGGKSEGGIQEKSERKRSAVRTVRMIMDEVLVRVECNVMMRSVVEELISGAMDNITHQETAYEGSNNVNSCPERPGGDGGGGGGIRRIQNKFGEIVWRRKPTSQASNSPNKRCRRSKTGRCLVHRCPYVEVCQRERWLKRGDDGKISVETKEVYREVCEIFAREGGLNYDRGGKSEGGRLSDASHVNRKLTDSHSSGRPAT